MMTTPDQPPPVEVPHGQLDPDTLRAVIESFVLREGTDYGDREVSLEDKVAQVLRQLQRGEARLFYDPATATITLAPAWEAVPPAAENP